MANKSDVATSDSRELEAVLAEWQSWPINAKPVIDEIYTAGLNHFAASLVSSEQQFVLKIFSAEGEKEIIAHQHAAILKLAPKLLYVSEHNNYVLMERIVPQHSLPKHLSAQHLRLLGSSLRKLHKSETNFTHEQDFDIREFCRDYLSLAGDKANKLHESVEPIVNFFACDSTEKGFCHNDLVSANCFLLEKSAIFIDWEFAGQNNPWFDLAAIIYYQALTDQQAAQFIGAYSQGLEESLNQPIFFSSQIALLWGDMLWHLAKFGQDFWPELAQKEKDLHRLTTAFTSGV